MHVHANLPVSVNRNDARSLVDQVADGLRQAIVSGYWRVGDEIPSTRELVPLLGVSHIVTRAALTRLCAEGLVLARTGLKPVVRDRSAKQWLGHVVLVSSGRADNYLQTVLSAELGRRLLALGYLFTYVDVPRHPDGSYDFSILDATFSRSVDLVIAHFDESEVFRYLARRKLPYVVVSTASRILSGALGLTTTDYGGAAPVFAAECARLGVRKVVQLYWERYMCDITPAFRGTGIEVRKVKVPVDKSQGLLAAVRDAGMRTFRDFAAKGRLANPDTVYFFSDDYLASGALFALADSGLSAPRDLRVATWFNKGLGIAYSRELSRMEFDPVEAGAAVAEAVTTYFKSGAYPSGTIVPHWFPGETLGAACASPGVRGQGSGIRA